jgi:hypothetical protein
MVVAQARTTMIEPLNTQSQTPVRRTEHEIAVMLCQKRESLGFADLAMRLNLSLEEVRTLVEMEWNATGDDGMYAQILGRGMDIIAALMNNGTTAEDLETYIDKYI